MRAFVLLTLAACSNAADPIAIDAPAHHIDASPFDAAKVYLDAPPAMIRILVVNEVVASGNPDWIEVVNATTSPVELSDFIFVDEHDNFAKAVPFPAQTLGPGGFATVDLDGVVVPFKLAADEEVWVYRASDHALSDGIDWADGDSPANGSFARVPDTFAPFAISRAPDQGRAEPALRDVPSTSEAGATVDALFDIRRLRGRQGALSESNRISAGGAFTTMAGGVHHRSIGWWLGERRNGHVANPG